jgi:aspartate-semialdehyde dehydrogenase
MSKAKKPSIAVIGATGMVGRELLRILEERNFKFSKIQLFASKKSRGEIINFGDDLLLVEELTNADQVEADIAFFAAGSKVSKTYIHKIASQGVICIDKSSYLRLDPNIPLVVNEVNIDKARNAPIIASPNCIATPLTQVLAPLHKKFGLEQVIISTYQAVSGAGKGGTDELESQVRDLFNMREVTSHVFDKRIAFNILPFIPAHGVLDSLGKTDEESKIIQETKKILDIPELKIEVTCVRVPVFNGHSMSVSIATKKPCEILEVVNTLEQALGIILINNTQKSSYPTALDACGNDMTLVGRVRPNTSVQQGLSLWIASDNLRTGAALNAVRIAETITTE